MSSPTAAQLEAGLAAHVGPLLAPLGFAATGAPERTKVGLVARTWGRPLREGKSLVLSVWCDGGSAQNLTWRLDVHDSTGNADLQLTFPFEVDGRPQARPLGGSHHSLSEFRPHLSAEHFARALQSLGHQLALHAEEIAEQVPELAPELEAALGTAPWKAARQAGPLVWARRYVEEEDPTRIELGEVGFAGETLARVHTASGRYSFKFPARGIENGDPAQLSGWWRNPAGAWNPRVLDVRGLRLEFDFFGRVRKGE